MKYCVVTTINEPTKAIEVLYEKFGSNLIIVGDIKTPENWEHKGITPIFDTKIYAPDNHYAKKNLGYLEAIKNKAQFIYDTDDDNIPNEKWKIRFLQIEGCVAESGGWYNVYNFFGMDMFWPRGFSLRHIKSYNIRAGVNTPLISSIQQGVSDGEPDIDAIARLVFIYGKIKFKNKASIFLPENTWCPINSQSTWWFPKAYPLLYLPIRASFRMTDIWRGFIAQRCLWEIGEGVTFHSPAEVFQERNEHDLLKDFEDEIPGYLKNDLIVEILGKLELKKGVENICENLLKCYAALVLNDILPPEEIKSVKQWIKDYKYITK